MRSPPVLPWMRSTLLRLRDLRPVQRQRAQRALPASAAAPAAPGTDDDGGARACGWFDSSHDLQRGLRVEEHLGADSLARELPLGAWLELQLGGQGAAPPGARAAAWIHAA